VQVTRVVVGVTSSAGSLQALRFAAGLARFHDATLMPVHAWMPPGGDVADRRYPNPDLRAVWERAARDRLSAAVEMALGGPPAAVLFAPVLAVPPSPLADAVHGLRGFLDRHRLHPEDAELRV
jgi:Universal stress protein family